jgi:hypothetical protein
MYPIAHLVGLALYDKAFQLSSLKSAHEVFSLTVLSGEKKIVLHWRDNAVNRPIIRTSSDGARDKELSGSLASKRLKGLGVKIRFRETLTWYYLRRLVLDAVDRSLLPVYLRSCDSR